MQALRHIRGGLSLGISISSVGILFLSEIGPAGGWTVPAILIGLILMGLSLALREMAAVHLSLFFLLLFGWKASPFWPRELPTGLLVPSMLYVSIALLLPPLRRSMSWFRRGRLDPSTWALSTAVFFFSAGALVAWGLLTENSIENYVYLFHPEILYIELVIFALLFAGISSLTQEIVFRGVLQNALQQSLGVGWALFIQASIFGLIHIAGVPSGLLGVLMAFVYGYALGLLRNLSGGLLLPILIHFLTDLVIFVLVFYKASRLDLLRDFPLL